jgi:hypothetical protein
VVYLLENDSLHLAERDSEEAFDIASLVCVLPDMFLSRSN